MRYIRFLKPPKIQDGQIKALITITSDLGESFFAGDVQLSVLLRSSDEHGRIYLRKGLTWKAAMRSLPLMLNIKQSNIDWPARVHVCVQDSPWSDDFEQHLNGNNLLSIISAWSDTLDPARGVHEASRTIERRFTPLNSPILCIWEETGESIARHIWDAGIVLSAYLDQKITHRAQGLAQVEDSAGLAPSRKLNVIELGSGCGIVGISLAQSIPHCDVLLTDLPEAREIAERNLSSMNPATGSGAAFQELNWDSPLTQTISSKTFDLILVADCTYNPDSGPALVRTLAALAETSPKSVVLLSMKIRHESEYTFFNLMAKAGFVQKIQVTLPLPELDNEPEEALVFAFHHKDRPVHVDNTAQPQSVIQFWPD